MTARHRIILGLMNIGPDPAKGARITSKDEFTKILDFFQDHGFDEVDTAQMYLEGEQERWTGEMNWANRGLKLATKLYPKPPMITHKPLSLRQNLNSSLESLRSESVDIFYLHAPDRTTSFSETLQELDSLHKKGRFKTLGLSNFAAFEVAEVMILCMANNWVRPTIYQGMYNILTRAIEPELIFVCRKYGLDIVAYNPLAGGLLTGKYRCIDDLDTDGRFIMDTDQGRRYRQRYFRTIYFEAIQLLKRAGEPHSISLAEISIRWLVHHSQLRMGGQPDDGRDGILIGISSFDHLQKNLKFLRNGPLPQEVIQAAEDSWQLVKVNCPNYWHGELSCYSYSSVSE